MKSLYVCRHGQSTANLSETYAGHLDTPLTDYGREQARQAARATDVKFDSIVSSPLIRAKKTADIIAGQQGYPLDKIIVNDLFKERFLGSLQGQPYTIGDEDELVFTDLEKWADLRARAAQGLNFLRNLPSDNILLVAHGSLLAAMRMELDPSANVDELDNAVITRYIP